MPHEKREGAATTSTTRSSGKLFLSGLAVLTVQVATLWYFWGTAQNPDWVGYRLIFDTGAYLEAQGRDPAFTALTAFFRDHVAYDYDAFRIWLRVYFILFFAAWLWNTRRDARQHATLGLTYIGFLPLTIPLFAVQIREGIGITFGLVGLRLLRRGGLAIVGIGLLFLASLTHASLTIFLGLATAGLLVLLANRAGLPRGPVLVFAGLAIMLIVASLSALGLLKAPLGSLGEVVGYGGAIETPLLKWAYWGLMGLVVLYVAWHARKALVGGQDLYTIFHEVAAYIALPILWVTAVVFVLGIGDARLAGAAIRAFHLLLLTLVATLGLSLRTSALWVLTVGLLIVDEYRTLFAAIPQ